MGVVKFIKKLFRLEEKKKTRSLYK